MNSFNLAIFNVKNNIKLFKFNIVSMVFSIAIFFNFFSLIFNPSLNLIGSDQLTIKASLYMTSISLVFFILFFILYSNSFFLKQRKKEIGIYTFMGIDNSSIALVFALEKIILGVMSLTLGLICGLVFQKAFLMILSKVATLKTEVTFYLSINAIIITSIVFISIFSIAALHGFISIARSKLIDLLNAEKYEDKLLKTRYVTGFMSIVLIFIAYFFSKKVFSPDFFIYGSIIMISIIIATFLLFSSFLSVIIKFMLNKKSILYNGTNIISVSNIAYRIRYNYKTLACITIIVAATITSIGVAFSIQHLFQSTVKISYPYSFSYVSSNSNVTKKVLNTINSSHHKVLSNIETKYLLFDSQKNKGFSKNHPVINVSNYNTIINSLNIKDADISEIKALKDGTAISVASSNDSGFQNKQLLDMYGVNIKIKKTITVPLLGSTFSNNTIVLTDNDYQKFKGKCFNLEYLKKENTFNGIVVSDQEESLELAKKLSSISELKNNLNSYVTYYDSFNKVTGIVKFTGLFLGIVFMISTASIMYMKLMSDAIADKEKYVILIKLGLDDKELYQTVSKQVGLSYTLPLFIGAVYSFMGIRVLQDFFNKYLEISLVKPYLGSLVIYATVYIFFYLFTTRKFISLIKS